MRDVERRAPQPRRHLLRGSFALVNLHREKGDWCCEWLGDLRHRHHILHDLRCFYALQETDHWTTSAMNVPGYIVYGTDHGRTAILCPREVDHFRRSWVDNGRCTAILLGSTMLLSVHMPHRGRDEVDYIEGLLSWREKEREPRIFSSAAT